MATTEPIRPPQRLSHLDELDIERLIEHALTAAWERGELTPTADIGDTMLEPEPAVSAILDGLSVAGYLIGRPAIKRTAGLDLVDAEHVAHCALARTWFVHYFRDDEPTVDTWAATGAVFRALDDAGYQTIRQVQS